MSLMLGVDVGQRHESSAICLVEIQERDEHGHTIDPFRVRNFPPHPSEPIRTEDHFLVRHLERIPAGRSFPEIAARVGEVIESVRRREARERRQRSVRIYVDVTGLGDPIVALLKRVTSVSMLHPVYFTHGDRREQERGTIRLGKAWLVTRLQTLLQDLMLHLPRTSDCDELAKDLLEFEIKVREDANEKYGAFPVGRHDDLVTALGLAVQERPPQITFGHLSL